MKIIIALLAVGVTAVVAVPTRETRMMGGSGAVISQYPSTASLLYTSDNRNYYQACIGTIITTKTIVTAAHCVQGDAIAKWRVRVGSSWANSGGSVYSLSSILIHPKFYVRTKDSDIAIVKTSVALSFSNLVRPASIAGSNYNLPDNQVVWAVGFGSHLTGTSEQLWQVQIWTINQTDCSSRYNYQGAQVTSNMLCAGNTGADNGALCIGDSGGPLFHNGVLVGIYSWGNGCSYYYYPDVNTRISNFTAWILSNSN